MIRQPLFRPKLRDEYVPNNGSPVRLSASMEKHMRFIDWMRARRTPPSRQEIQEFLGCSRATASRWMTAWRLITESEE